MRTERLGSEPCASLVCIRQTLPALPSTGTSRLRSDRSTAGATKPVKRSPSNSECTGPRWLPGTAMRQPLSAVMSSSMRRAVTTASFVCGV